MKSRVTIIAMIAAIIMAVVSARINAAEKNNYSATISWIQKDGSAVFMKGLTDGVVENEVFVIMRGEQKIAIARASKAGKYMTWAKVVAPYGIIEVGDTVTRESREPWLENIIESEDRTAPEELPGDEVPLGIALEKEEKRTSAQSTRSEPDDTAVFSPGKEEKSPGEKTVEIKPAAVEPALPEKPQPPKAPEGGFPPKNQHEIKKAKNKYKPAVVLQAKDLEKAPGKKEETAAGTGVSEKKAKAPQAEHVYPGKKTGGPDGKAPGGKAEAVHAPQEKSGQVMGGGSAEQGQIGEGRHGVEGESGPMTDTAEEASTGPVPIDKKALQLVKSRKLSIDLSGYRYFKMRTFSASGSESSFLSRNGLLTNGNRFEQGTMLSVHGLIGGKMEITGELTELIRQERTMDFKLNAGNFKARMGDFASEFRSGSIVKLAKKVSGVQAQYDGTKTKADYVSSMSKSTPKTVSFFGDNTHGPYSLKAFQILQNSERVRINGVSIPYEDYTMDYFSGQITFCSEDHNCRIIKTSDRVQVVFEEKMLFADKGGAVNAMSASYKLSEKFNVGVAHVSQQAARGSQRVRKAAAATVTATEMLDAIARGACPNKTICLQKTYKGQYAMMVKKFEKITKITNGVSTPFTDFSISDRGYARGEIFLPNPVGASDTFKIEYSYYAPEFIKEVQLGNPDGLLRDETGSTSYFPISNGIYAGTEIVYFCEVNDIDIDKCIHDRTLAPGVDYVIREDTSSLQVLDSRYYPNDTLNRFIEMTYYYAPRAQARESIFDHTVSEIYGDATVGPVSLKYELGKSRGDISKTPVQVMKSKVGTIDRSYNCPASSPPSGCVFRLNHSNIVELSETITDSKRNSPLILGRDYNIDYDAGGITFMNYEFSTGSVILANYQYLPEISEGIVDGNATKISAGFQLKGFNVLLSKSSADTVFSPVEGNNTLETERTETMVGGELFKGLSVSVGKVSFITASDAAETSVVNTDQKTASAQYKRKSLSIGIEKYTETATDNLRIRAREDQRDGTRLNFGIEAPFIKGLTLTTNSSDETFKDKTGSQDNTNSKSTGYGIKYLRERVIDASLNIEKTSLTNQGVSGAFTSDNLSRNLLISYYPSDKIQVGADMKTQAVTDSRQGGGAGKNETSLSISATDMGKIRSAVISQTNNSIPAYNSSPTNTKTTSMSLEYALNNDIAIKPAINITSSSAGEGGSSNFKKGVQGEYRPGHERYAATMSIEQSDITTRNAATKNSGTQLRLFGDALYNLNKKSNLIFRTDHNTYSMSSSTSTTFLNSLTYNLMPSEKKNFTFQYSRTQQDAAQVSTTDGQASLRADIKLSKIFSWVTEIKNSKFESSNSRSAGYTGTLVESEIRGEF